MNEQYNTINSIYEARENLDRESRRNYNELVSNPLYTIMSGLNDIDAGSDEHLNNINNIKHWCNCDA